jgi:hypothetical protein
MNPNDPDFNPLEALRHLIGGQRRGNPNIPERAYPTGMLGPDYLAGLTTPYFLHVDSFMSKRVWAEYKAKLMKAPLQEVREARKMVANFIEKLTEAKAAGKENATYCAGGKDDATREEFLASNMPSPGREAKLDRAMALLMEIQIEDAERMLPRLDSIIEQREHQGITGPIVVPDTLGEL